jgi:hypothetical protein
MNITNSRQDLFSIKGDKITFPNLTFLRFEYIGSIFLLYIKTPQSLSDEAIFLW